MQETGGCCEHGLQSASLREFSGLKEALGAAGDAYGLIGNSFEVRGCFHRGEDAAEIMSDRLKTGDDRDAVGIDLLLQAIHFLVFGDDPVAKVFISAGERPCCAAETLFCERGHAKQIRSQIIQIAVKTA